jgi:phosphatidate cytidylyltransferase
MSNLLKRTVIGIIGIPFLVFFIWMGDVYFLVLCIVIQALCLYEFFSMFDKNGFRPLKYLSVMFSVVVFVLYYLGYELIFPVSVFFIVLIFSAEIFRKTDRNPVNPFLIVSGYVYITVPFILLFELDSEYRFVIYLMLMIWTNDIAAYFMGKYFGKHKLSEVSPNKTIEGSVSGIIFTILISIVFFIFNKDIMKLGDALILGVITGVAGQAGDLFESLLKRFNNVKDSSGIIPGHGGLLDRFDSLIFSVPLLYVYLNFLKL